MACYSKHLRIESAQTKMPSNATSKSERREKSYLGIYKNRTSRMNRFFSSVKFCAFCWIVVLAREGERTINVLTLSGRPKKRWLSNRLENTVALMEQWREIGAQYAVGSRSVFVAASIVFVTKQATRKNGRSKKWWNNRFLELLNRDVIAVAVVVVIAGFPFGRLFDKNWKSRPIVAFDFVFKYEFSSTSV